MLVGLRSDCSRSLGTPFTRPGTLIRVTSMYAPNSSALRWEHLGRVGERLKGALVVGGLGSGFRRPSPFSWCRSPHFDHGSSLAPLNPVCAFSTVPTLQWEGPKELPSMIPSCSRAVHEILNLGVPLGRKQVEPRHGYRSKMSYPRSRICHSPVNGSHLLEFRPTVCVAIANGGPRENCDA